MSTESNRDLLGIALSAAVPIAIHDLRHCSDDERISLAAECSQHIAEHGDIILYRSPKRGETAKAFAHLARGLAAGAYQPGGITFLGQHWCVNHQECETAERASDADRAA